ncbi:hypothetical protein [Pedobacter sp. Leaf250]|nr:hypothetical protein [Pedobacter sp. Leaf250]
MKASIKIASIFALIFCLFSACRNEEKQQNTVTIPAVSTHVDTAGVKAEPKARLENPQPDFPTSGNKIEDLIPQYFEVDLEASGDLNHDGLEDKVLVLINTRDTSALRPTLVIFKIGNAYSVNAKSFTVIEPKYREDGYLNYDFEDVSIDKNGQLVFTQQSTGPNGSLESTFKYINNELVLININSFAMGAGGQTALKLDLFKGVFEQTDINTM